MAKVGLEAKNKSHSVFDVDKFKMKTGEKARVLVIEQEFEVEFRHWVEGFGYALCQGDYPVLMNEGSDPHCKFCQAAATSKAVGQARRSFVSLIAQYRTNKNGQLLEPVSVEILPWVFGDDKFNDLLGKKEQWGDLRSHDLQITCHEEKYQKMTIDILPDARWLKDGESKKLVADSYKEAKSKYSKDLRLILGREVSDPEKLAEVLRDATGVGNVPDYAAAADIGNMFSSEIDTPPAAELDFTSMLQDGISPATVELEVAAAAEVSPVPQEPVEVPAADPLSASATVGAAEDFDDLLDA